MQGAEKQAGSVRIRIDFSGQDGGVGKHGDHLLSGPHQLQQSNDH